jgi:hypothetical protein
VALLGLHPWSVLCAGAAPGQKKNRQGFGLAVGVGSALLRASLDSFRQWPEKAEKVEGEEGREARHGNGTVPHRSMERQVAASVQAAVD